MSFFTRKREELVKAGIDPDRIPPGQYHTDRFPVLHAGVVPNVDLATWDFTIDGLVAEEKAWSWDDFRSMPAAPLTADIHCVTKWSKFDSEWQGVSVDDLLAAAGVEVSQPYLLVTCETGYTTNLPVEDVVDGRAMVAHTYGGEPLDPEHGGPARLLVPHLYFWKSAKWVRGLQGMDDDGPGFWEGYGYHMRGDPWLEQRYRGD